MFTVSAQVTNNVHKKKFILLMTSVNYLHDSILLY